MVTTIERRHTTIQAFLIITAIGSIHFIHHILFVNIADETMIFIYICMVSFYPLPYQSETMQETLL